MPNGLCPWPPCQEMGHPARSLACDTPTTTALHTMPRAVTPAHVALSFLTRKSPMPSVPGSPGELS